MGDVIHYSYVIKNTGNVTLSGPFTVNDDKVTVICPAGNLAPGASLTCPASYTIKQSDLDAGAVTNHATATNGKVTSNQDQLTVPATQKPDLTLAKSASPVTYNAAGQTVSYSYKLTNSGNVTLAGPFTVSDDKATVTCPSTPTSLAPGTSLTCTASYMIKQSDVDLGSVTNHATAYAKFGTTTLPSNADEATVTAVQSPAISLVKSASPTTYNAVGQVINYSYVIKNTGNVTLSGPFTVSDDKLGAIPCPAGSWPLAPRSPAPRAIQPSRAILTAARSRTPLAPRRRTSPRRSPEPVERNGNGAAEPGADVSPRAPTQRFIAWLAKSSSTPTWSKTVVT